MTDRELDLRRLIFESFAATGEGPVVEELDAEVLAELERLHVVVVRDGRVWMAHPFAGHQRGTRVVASYGREWWGNCAWDGLGIVAALGLSSAVITSGDLTVRVIADQPVDDALFHVAVPAAHWWDDIEFTRRTMRLVRSADEADGGALMSVQQLWELARVWYGDRLDPEWRPRTRDDSQRMLADVGLDGEFWQLA